MGKSQEELQVEVTRLQARIDELIASLPRHEFPVGERLHTSVGTTDVEVTIVRADKWQSGACLYTVKADDGVLWDVEDCDLRRIR